MSEKIKELRRVCRSCVSRPRDEHCLLCDIADPAVERQEPVGRVSYVGNGFIRVRCQASPPLETLLYTAPPALVVTAPCEHCGKCTMGLDGETKWCAYCGGKL